MQIRYGELVQPICERYFNVTDRRTNGRTTYDSNNALCTTCIARWIPVTMATRR